MRYERGGIAFIGRDRLRDLSVSHITIKIKVNKYICGG